MAIVLGLFGVLFFCVVFRGAIYDRLVRFPALHRAWEGVRKQVKPVGLDDGWTEYRGVCHSHSALSHDSEVAFDDVLTASKMAQLDFIMMSDHCTEGVGDFSLQWRGVHDEVLFLPGFETSSGLLIWGLAPGEQIDCNQEIPELVASARSRGGVAFFAHTEEERPYEVEGVSGMEIYNIHTDLKDEKFSTLIGSILLNYGSYPDESLYAIFDVPTNILSLWDKLNTVGDWTGIAANDAHQNVGVLARWDDDGTVRLSNTADDPITTVHVPEFLLHWLFQKPAAGQPLLRLDLDPYERSLRFVNTHVLARELSEPALLESLQAGRVFIGFDMIADSSGFVFFADRQGSKAVMGESMPFGPAITLQAAAPAPCRLRLYRDGTPVEESEGVAASWTPKEPGKYRVSAELKILGEWVPWIISNPISLEGPVS